MPSVTGWSSGPLPVAELEQAALKIFTLTYAMQDWADPRMSVERNACRRLALQLRIDFLKLDRWTLGTAAEQCAECMGQLIAGDRGLFPAEVATLRDYAASCIQDLFGLFMGDQQAKGRTESWKHVPEDEPDDSELEVIVTKKAQVQ